MPWICFWGCWGFALCFVSLLSAVKRLKGDEIMCEANAGRGVGFGACFREVGGI